MAGGRSEPEDPACAAAHTEVPGLADAIAQGTAAAPADGRTLVAVFSSGHPASGRCCTSRSRSG